MRNSHVHVWVVRAAALFSAIVTVFSLYLATNAVNGVHATQQRIALASCEQTRGVRQSALDSFDAQTNFLSPGQTALIRPTRATLVERLRDYKNSPLCALRDRP